MQDIPITPITQQIITVLGALFQESRQKAKVRTKDTPSTPITYEITRVLGALSGTETIYMSYYVRSINMGCIMSIEQFRKNNILRMSSFCQKHFLHLLRRSCTVSPLYIFDMVNYIDWYLNLKSILHIRNTPLLGHEVLIFRNRWLILQQNFVSISWRILVFGFLLYSFRGLDIKVVVVEYSLFFQAFEFFETIFMAHNMIYSVKCSICTWKGNLLCHLKLSIKSS